MSSDTESRHARAHCRICGGPLAAMQSCGKCMWQAHQGWIAELDDAKAQLAAAQARVQRIERMLIRSTAMLGSYQPEARIRQVS